jgi:hypothetical protein
MKTLAFPIALLFLLSFIPSVDAITLTDQSIWDDTARFWGDESEFFDGDWQPPEWYRHWWNESSESLDVPPSYNRTTGVVDFQFEFSENATLWVILYGINVRIHDHWVGPVLEIQGFATSGVVIHWSNWSYVDSISGSLNSSQVNKSGFYKMHLHGHTYDGETLRENRVFFWETSDLIQEEQNINGGVVPDNRNPSDVDEMSFDARIILLPPVCVCIIAGVVLLIRKVK